jgi:LPS sulfotransferase NodH
VDTDAARFVILNAPRAGSNYLCTVLNSHPEILCHHEIFNPHVVGVARHLQLSAFVLGTIEERERDPEQFLERVWRTPMGRKCIGFKLCWRQHPAALRAVLSDLSVRKIVLKRRNQIKGFVSLVLARQTGEWVVYDDAPPPLPRPHVYIDVDTMKETLEFNRCYYEEIESTLAGSGQQYLELFYEQLFSPDCLASVLTFLGVAPDAASALSGQCRKLTPESLTEVIANFDELSRALHGTALEHDLHSPGV